MISKIALISAASLLVVSVAAAQNAPPPGNVNPASKDTGAEQTGAPNQPRSSGEQKGTTGAAPRDKSGAAPMEKDSSPSSTAGGAAGTSKKGNDN